MLMQPKGYEYWYIENDIEKIKADAPDWAKKEFQEYQEIINNAEQPDENGNINSL
ncbi:hypothetical protein ACWOB3_07745 [Enterococcus songbeiensis]